MSNDVSLYMNGSVNTDFIVTFCILINDNLRHWFSLHLRRLTYTYVASIVCTYVCMNKLAASWNTDYHECCVQRHKWVEGEWGGQRRW